MTLQQLKFIITVWQEKTIFAASQRLHISHTTISKSISALEAELGTNIFIRTRTGSVLTEKGKEIVASAQKILAEMENIYMVAGQTAGSSSISMSVFPIDSMFFLPDVITEFYGCCPNSKINMTQGHISPILDEVASQKLDFGLIAVPKTYFDLLPSGLKKTVLLDEELCVLCSPSSELAKKEHLSLEELQEQPLIVHDDPYILTILNDYLGNLENYNIIMHSNDNILIKKMIASGNGVGLYTSFLAHQDPYVLSNQVILKPICSPDRLHMQFLLICNNKKKLSAEEKVFIRLLKNMTKKWRTDI